jgi:hypothetical protein
MTTAVYALLILAAVSYVLASRWRGRPIVTRRLLLMPAVLSGYGLLLFTGSSARGLRAVDVTLIAAGVVVSAAMGMVRGASVSVFVRDGRPWMRYRLLTLALWAATVAVRLGVTVVSNAVGASAATRGPALLLSVGVTLLAEGAVISRRALSGNQLPWQARSRRQTLATR